MIKNEINQKRMNSKSKIVQSDLTVDDHVSLVSASCSITQCLNYVEASCG